MCVHWVYVDFISRLVFNYSSNSRIQIFEISEMSSISNSTLLKDITSLSQNLFSPVKNKNYKLLIALESYFISIFFSFLKTHLVNFLGIQIHIKILEKQYI